MVKLARTFWKPILGVLILGLIASVVPFTGPRPKVGVANTQLVTRNSEQSQPLIGTGSCSARGCHGSIEPVSDPKQCQQNEYTHWMQDPHADAYRTLFSERSQSIVKRLGGMKKAHEEPRCLACHTNPLLAQLPEENSFVQQEKQFGVGCESCHGNANQWLVAHTAPDWRVKKLEYSMPDLTDLTVQAKTCVGCHVGAPPDGDLPLRDVNHDMIAAGHPRLTFEFGAYQANMLPHWRRRKTSAGPLWAVGQLESAQAALALLTHRSKAGPWPEFAEYDCFACHQSLGEPSSVRSRVTSGRKPGTLPWGSWYFAFTDQLVGDAPELKSLKTIMQQPLPSRSQVDTHARAALKKLKRIQTQPTTENLLALVKDGATNPGPSWDAVEQTYLALSAMNESQADPAVTELLRELTPLRAFPPGFDGPAHFRAQDIMDKLKRLR